MAELVIGSVKIVLPENLDFDQEKAGHLSVHEQRRLTKARAGVGYTCRMTADGLVQFGSRIPHVVEAQEVADAGIQADMIDSVIRDLEAAVMILKQANLLLDHDAHELLRKVLAAVRAAEKFDPTAATFFPQLIQYFAGSRPEPQAPAAEK